jgi:hypothetical protein
MSFLGIGDEVAKPIEAVGKLYTTDKERIAAQANYEDIAQRPMLSQLANNGIMASSSIFFNSAWQPMIGWTAGFLILLYYFPQITIATYVWGKHCILIGDVIPFPIKPDDIFNLIYLLFGFGIHSLFRKNKSS